LAGSQEGAGREAERIVRRLDGGGTDAGEPAGGRAMGSPEGEGLGKFYFEDRR
jgi:hypothetical protein